MRSIVTARHANGACCEKHRWERTEQGQPPQQKACQSTEALIWYMQKGPGCQAGIRGLAYGIILADPSVPWDGGAPLPRRFLLAPPLSGIPTARPRDACPPAGHSTCPRRCLPGTQNARGKRPWPGPPPTLRWDRASRGCPPAGRAPGQRPHPESSAQPHARCPRAACWTAPPGECLAPSKRPAFRECPA